MVSICNIVLSGSGDNEDDDAAMKRIEKKNLEPALIPYKGLRTHVKIWLKSSTIIEVIVSHYIECIIVGRSYKLGKDKYT